MTMKVKILVEFEVESLEDEDLTENHAKGAASMATYDYLSLVKVSGYTSDTPVVQVHVDGFGECRVSLGEDHE